MTLPLGLLCRGINKAGPESPQWTLPNVRTKAASHYNIKMLYQVPFAYLLTVLDFTNGKM